MKYTKKLLENLVEKVEEGNRKLQATIQDYSLYYQALSMGDKTYKKVFKRQKALRKGFLHFSRRWRDSLGMTVPKIIIVKLNFRV